jgi:hypothetical protein
MKSNILFTSFLLVINSYFSSAQEIFNETDESEITTTSTRYIVPKKYTAFEINSVLFSTLLNQAQHEEEVNVHQSDLLINIPFPNGEVHTFRFVESPVMSLNLSSRHQSIKTYLGESLRGNMTMRFDYSPDYGFHAMIMGQTDVVFIDPYSFHNSDYIISYYKKDYINEGQIEFNEGEPIQSAEYLEYINYKDANPIDLDKISSGEELRSYRIAIACTQQYSNFHGGTTESTLAGMVTTLNRVNEVYETELSIRLIMVDNNDSLIDYSLDWGMSNYNTGALINQSQEVIDEFIGDDNYDIGHTFSTGAGGLASLGVPCKTNQKGNGVTGTNSPTGDPYDIDYVAHEIGHQFGANHTFNGNAGSCNGNRNSGTAYEPGSGSTIMAYAGICSSNNLQSNSDPYFHPASYDEITYYINSAYGNTCAQISETGNSAPEVFIEETIYTIPVYTAFKIDGSASDSDGDTLTYSWEQMDLGPAGHPDSPVNNAPIFRTFNPKTVSSRIFPRMSDLLNNTHTKGELIPEYVRTLHFRLTARDNKAGGGGISFQETEVEVTEQAGPFEIISPNGNETWGINGTYTVEWEVADTDGTVVNCQEVNIILMYKLDGIWEEVILAENVENNGETEVVVPNLENLIGSENRIKIIPTNNIFFDISNEDFSITGMNIFELEGGNIAIYPNPSTGSINIKIDQVNHNIIQLNVYDLSGKLIHTEKIQNKHNSTETKLNLTDVEKGLYLLELNTPNERIVNTISIL